MYFVVKKLIISLISVVRHKLANTSCTELEDGKSNGRMCFGSDRCRAATVNRRIAHASHIKPSAPLGMLMALWNSVYIDAFLDFHRNEEQYSAFVLFKMRKYATFEGAHESQKSDNRKNFASYIEQESLVVGLEVWILNHKLSMIEPLPKIRKFLKRKCLTLAPIESCLELTKRRNYKISTAALVTTESPPAKDSS
ncbi:hypothetical protein RF11_12221 [Thelohanellus kitauei]|uniref:Uncharacterized protein n=1 Tax=Thelohanellus kitauei TaxID=669202 RepID=A0A0C2J654_THEKT|nr:hypothetical protein RF11_12221 [Thelohanellus kitauei]